MKVIKIKIADRIIELHVNFGRTCRMCHDFLTDKASDFLIECTYEDYDKEKMLFESQYKMEAPGDIQLEVFSLLHKIADKLVEYDTFLMHGAVICVDDKAYLFSAQSGTGKTTHIMKWLDKLPNAYVVNGDKPFIKINKDGSVYACGSPWSGKEKMYTNTMVPLHSIVLLERSQNNSIEKLTLCEAFPFLLSQIHRPEDEDKMRKTLQLIKHMSPYVSFWRFNCNNYKDDCFEVAYNALVRDQK